MSEEINPSAPKPRPQPATSSQAGGGAKITAIILAVLVAVLGFALFKANTGAGHQAESDAATITSLSNQVTELRTKLALEHSNLDLAQSNHFALLHRRTAELNTTSNRLVQTALLLDRAREETRIAQAAIPSQAVAVATLEAQRDELQRQAAQIPGLQQEIAELKEQVQQGQFARAALDETLGLARASQAELERKLEDPAFLRLQARRADEAAALRQRTAAGESIRVTDRRVRLELQPDGTVRPAHTVGISPEN